MLATLEDGGRGLVGGVVAAVATRCPRHVDRAELMRAGELGLVEAARRWDAGTGVPFERFAAIRIRGAVLDALRAADWAPRSVRANERRIETVEQSLSSWLGRRPTELELATALGVTPEWLREQRARIARSVMLAFDRLTFDDSDDSGPAIPMVVDPEALEPVEILEHRELLAYLRDAVTLLEDRHRRVIEGTYFDGLAAAPLAEELGVTESRISQLRTEALVHLRRGIAAQYGLEPQERAKARPVRIDAGFPSAIARARSWERRLDATESGWAAPA